MTGGANQQSRILLADRDDEFRKLVVPVLEGRGHQVIQATRADQAIEMAGSGNFDLIILDASLPDTDAIAWISQLRTTGKATPAIVTSTGWREKEDRSTELGVVLYIHKPVIPLVFGEQVQHQLRSIAEDVPKTPYPRESTRHFKLRLKYARQLMSKLELLENALTLARSAPGDPSLLRQAEFQAHKLAGTTGTYGFLEVGKLLSAMEATLVNARKVSPEQALWPEEIDRLLADTKRAAQLAIQEIESGSARTAPAAWQQASTILVVDSDPLFLQELEHVEQKREIKVVRAASQAEALAEACTSSLSAAFVSADPDVDHDPFQLVAVLRRLPGYEMLPVAVTAGTNDVHCRLAAARANASAFLVKPIAVDALKLALEELLTAQRSHRQGILILDDDEAFVETIAATLEREGFVAHKLTDPLKVLPVLEKAAPDLLLLDVQMGTTSGFDVCRKLRSISQWQDLPVIFLTLQTQIESRVAAFQAGGDDYLAKPVVNEELLARVKVHLERSRLLKQLKSLAHDLASARDQAMQASQFKSQFLANMVHEIRTPMSAAIGMIKLLGDTPLTEEQDEMVNLTQRSTEALLEIVNDILDLSKVEAGKLDLKPADFQLHSVVEDVAALLTDNARKNQTNIMICLASDVPPNVIGDAGRLRQVLVNLMANAIKFTQAGEVVVSVSNEASDQRRVPIKFAVRDTGPGISSDTIKRLFQPYSQAKHSSMRKHGGTGLGLCISKHLVELMGGEIGVESQEGTGSTFWFTIPFERSQCEEIATSTSAELKERESADTAAATSERFERTDKGTSSPQAPGKRVLVAEDDEVNQKIASFQLEQLGYIVECVDDGRKAVERLSHGGYALVLMDCEMPEVDGFQAAHLIRQMEAPAGRHTPIIALTANTTRGYAEKCIAAGMDDYLFKPTNPALMKALLEHWLSGEQQGSIRAPLSREVAADKAAPLAIDSGPPIDLAQLEAIYGSESMRTVLDSFITSSAAAMKKLGLAIDQQDAQEVRSLAHKFKGACASIGARQMAGLAEGVEIAVKGRNWLDVCEHFAHLKTGYEQVTSFLQQTQAKAKS